VPPFDFVRALVLGLVEGATEFIPVSSTGHLILVGHWLAFTGRRAAVFEIVIQLGAILAVAWQYRGLLYQMTRDLVDRQSPAHHRARHFVIALFVAFMPAAIVGLIAHDWITDHLFRPLTVALALVAGGIAMLVIERKHRTVSVTRMDEMPFSTALGIGFAQCLSLFPGVSRSGATIMGALAIGVARPVATEFSFLLALPVMFAASGLDLVSNREILSGSDIPLYVVGLATAFVSALIVIRFLIRFVARHTFDGFAWYRIVFGGILLAAMALGWISG
jgi:undecaprenyl-diphosphatase